MGPLHRAAAGGRVHSSDETSESVALHWTSERSFTVGRHGTTEYVCRPLRGFASEPGRFCLRKDRALVALYEGLLEELRPEAVVEVGIFDGASTALIAELATPERLIALDNDPKPRPALDEFVARTGRSDVIRVHDDVDQADVEHLRRILAADLGDRPLDLVVDDASHLLAQTRTTFDVCFPRLRAGGVYVIEDWSWAHGAMPMWKQETPLTVLVFELVVACARIPDVVREVTVGPTWARVTRGEGQVDPSTFGVGASLDERGRALIDG